MRTPVVPDVRCKTSWSIQARKQWILGLGKAHRWRLRLTESTHGSFNAVPLETAVNAHWTEVGVFPCGVSRLPFKYRYIPRYEYSVDYSIRTLTPCGISAIEIFLYYGSDGMGSSAKEYI